jgi:hypothetical protein
MDHEFPAEERTAIHHKLNMLMKYKQRNILAG